MLVVLAMCCSAGSARKDLQEADKLSTDPAGTEWHDQVFHDLVLGFQSQHSQWLHDWDNNDPQHRQFLQHIGRIMLEANLTDSNSTVAVPVDDDEDSSDEDSVDDQDSLPDAAALGVSSDAASPDVVSAGSVALLSLQNSSGSLPVTNSSTNPVVAAIEAKEIKLNEAFRQALASYGIYNVSAPMLRYYRVKSTRVMLLLADVAWLVYAVAGFAQRTFALLVPIVKIGQTGELTVNAASLLSLAQLAADFVARFGDLIAKVFLVLFRGINLANTLPPATG
jgi:hypothetical protein